VRDDNTGITSIDAIRHISAGPLYNGPPVTLLRYGHYFAPYSQFIGFSMEVYSFTICLSQGKRNLVLSLT
jgi:hypothetical protein